MQPHSPYLPALTSKSVNRLTKGLLARRAALSTYLTYPHLQPPVGIGAPPCNPSRPQTTQNGPLSLKKMVVFLHLTLQKSPNYAFPSYLTEVACFHLRHLQPLTSTYAPTRNPHLHTYPPFKGGKCEWWRGEIHD
jgi:hypothetical protein